MNLYESRLAYLYEKYRDSTCTPDERTEFMTMVNNEEATDELNRLIEKDVVISNADKIIAAPRANELFNLILEKSKKRVDDTRSLSKIFTLRRVAVAASIVFLLGLGTYFLLLNNKQKEPVAKNDATEQQRFKNDVKPGGNKAIITLADGSIVVLDSAANGMLTQQGGTKVIKLDNGEVAYTASNVDEGKVLYNTISTPKGGQYQLVLADGSKVWLNAASSLRFPAAFSGNERKVELSGEAYFEVAKNAEMPFKVEVSGMEVAVLGTHFNINAYTDEADIKTTLMEGAIKLKKGNSSQLLSPGQQAQLNKKDEIKVIADADIEETMAWKNGQFIFTGNDIQTVMRRLEKWYDIEVEYKGNVTKEEFVGIISRNVNISQILKMLEKTHTVSFEIDGKRVIVQ